MRELVRTIPLEECGIEIVSGQIMGRIAVREGSDEEVVATRRVVVPKCIHSDGSLDPNAMPEENLHTDADPKRLTEEGDIVIKLSTPYDAAYVGAENAGCIVPSFCATIKSSGILDKNYLLAFLNSSTCKRQLKNQVAGAAMAMLSVGKIKAVRIPVPDREIQNTIGSSFLETQRKVYIMEQIICLEQKKNDIYFRDMVKNNAE